MVQVCEGDRLPGADAGRFYLLRSNGNRSHEVWDVTDPASPAFVRTVAEMGRTPSGDQHTHKNWWECDTRRRLPGGHRRRLARAAHPADVRPGRPGRPAAHPRLQPARRPAGRERTHTRGIGPARGGQTGQSHLHGVRHLRRRRRADPRPRPAAERGPGCRRAARDVSPAALAYPQIGRIDLPSYWGAHTAIPLLDVEIADYAGNSDNATRDFLFVVSESTANSLPGDAPRHAHARHHGRGPPPADRYLPGSGIERRFLRPGRPFRPARAAVVHGAAVLRKADGRVVVQRGRAGHRRPRPVQHGGGGVLHTRHDRPRTAERCATIDGVEICQVAIQTNNVEVDDRGLIYLTDRATPACTSWS